MIIADLPYLQPLDAKQVLGGQQRTRYDNRAAAIAFTYADSLDGFAVAGTSVFIDRGFSKSASFSVAQSG